MNLLVRQFYFLSILNDIVLLDYYIIYTAKCTHIFCSSYGLLAVRDPKITFNGIPEMIISNLVWMGFRSISQRLQMASR